MAKIISVRLDDDEIERLDRNAALPGISGNRSKYVHLALRWFHQRVEGPDGRKFLNDAITNDTSNEPANVA